MYNRLQQIGLDKWNFANSFESQLTQDSISSGLYVKQIEYSSVGNFMRAHLDSQSKGVFLSSFCLWTLQMPTHSGGCLPRATSSRPRNDSVIVQITKAEKKGK